jgi:hypothetical protein
MVQTAGRPLESQRCAAIGQVSTEIRIEERAFDSVAQTTISSCHVIVSGKKRRYVFVSTSLLSKITQTLHQDESLMAQLEDLQVTSRVRSPSWKSCSRPNPSSCH